MNTPHLYYVTELVKWANTTQTQHPEAGWIPARPLGFQGFSLKRRLKLAWAVFTGKYDAVYWEPTLLDLYPREDNSDLNVLLGQAIDAARGVNIFTEPAMESHVLAATSASVGWSGSRELAATSATPAMRFKELPRKVDLREGMPPVVDQGKLNSSTACALTAALAATPIDMNNVGCLPLVYYNERALDDDHTS